MADLTLRLCLHGHSEVKRDAVTQINEIIGLHFNSASRPNNFLIHPPGMLLIGRIWGVNY